MGRPKLPATSLKVCCACGETRPRFSFHKRGGRCYSCRSSTVSAMISRKKSWAKWYLNPKNRHTRQSKRKETDKAYRLRNRTQINERARIYQRRPDVRLYHNMRKRLSRHGASKKELVLLMDSYLGRCVYCFKPLSEPTIDHITPITRGGGNESENLVPACRSCNASKSDKLLILWLAWKNAA